MTVHCALMHSLLFSDTLSAPGVIFLDVIVLNICEKVMLELISVK